jgi:hypothetical protein
MFPPEIAWKTRRELEMFSTLISGKNTQENRKSFPFMFQQQLRNEQFMFAPRVPG